MFYSEDDHLKRPAASYTEIKYSQMWEIQQIIPQVDTHISTVISTPNIIIAAIITIVIVIIIISWRG